MRLQFRQNGLLTEAMKPRRPDAVWVAVFGGGGSGVGVGHGFYRADFAFDDLDDVVGEEDFAAVPERLVVERHELDESRFEASLAAELRHGDDVGFDESFHGDDVEFDVPEAGGDGGIDAGSTRRQVVAAGDLPEAFAVERVEVDVQTAQAGGVKIACACLSEQDGVGGEGDVADAFEWPRVFRSGAADRGARAVRRR